MLSAPIAPCSKLSVLAAPISPAASDAVSDSASAACLWGTVTFAPTNPSSGSARVRSANSCGDMSIAS